MAQRVTSNTPFWFLTDRFMGQLTDIIHRRWPITALCVYHTSLCFPISTNVNLFLFFFRIVIKFTSCMQKYCYETI